MFTSQVSQYTALLQRLHYVYCAMALIILMVKAGRPLNVQSLKCATIKLRREETRTDLFVRSFVLMTGAQLGWGAPPAFHTLAKEMSLNRGVRHFTLGHILCHPFYYKYTCAPLSKLTSCAPDVRMSLYCKYVRYDSSSLSASEHLFVHYALPR